jgi:CheY-like chemotaxis protein/signal transduction histidine kinase
LTLPEKQNLRELAAMAMDAMVDRRSQKKNSIEDRSKQIACAAHDLLTPLSGVQMSVSLLQEDTQLMNVLDAQQRELIDTAGNCSDMMSRICHETIETFRGDVHQTKQDSQARRVSPNGEGGGAGQNGGAGGLTARQLKTGQKAIHLASLVKNITMVMDPYPKKVPLYITIDPTLPKEFISNDLKVFRSVINYLTNACKHTQRGCVHLKIFKIEKKAKSNTNKLSKNPSNMFIMFEVEDTGKGIPLEKYSGLFRPFRDDEMGENETADNCIAVGAEGNVVPGGGVCTPEMDTPGLGLYSVATNVGSIGGEYGFHPREVANDEENENLKSGSIFWFSLPLSEPAASERIKQEQQEDSTMTSPAADKDGAPAVSNGAGNNSFKNKTVKEGIKQYHSQSSTARRKVIICDHLPKDAMRAPRVSVLKNGVKALRLCAGSWNDESLISSSSIVSCTKSALESQMSVDLDLPTRSENGNDIAASSSAEPNHFKVLSTSNLTETDAKDVFEMVNSVYNDNKIPSSGNGPSPDKVKNVSIRIPSSSDLNPNAPRKKRALVIDDSLVIRKSIGRALITMGFDVTQATNGMEGLHELQSSVFDVVLCDFLMPVMDGLDCVQQYRSWEENHRPSLKQYIIGISAHANPRDIERGIACGMSSFLSKPLPIKVLRELQGSKHLTDMSKKLDEMNTTNDIPLQMGEGEFSMMMTDDATDLVDEANGGGGKQQRKAGGGVVRSAFRRRKSQQERDEESSSPICLIAEDSKTVAKVVIRAIEGRGWRTSWAENGEEALRLLKTRNWDAVFLDDEMPRMNGTHCLERFRAWEKENRVATQKHVIFMSGNYIPPPPGAETSCAALPKGFDGAVGKPVLLKDLYSFLSKAEEEGKDEKNSSDIMHR